MVIFGGIVGFLLCYVFVAAPVSAAMASHLGVALVVPVFGGIAAPIGGIALVPALVIHIVLVLIAYILATAATLPAATGTTGAITLPAGPDLVEQFARGLLIGINACFTLLVLPFAVPWLRMVLSGSPLAGAALAAATMGPLTLAAIVICLINLGALWTGASGNPVYAAFLGWSAWIAPGAWPANLVGLLFVLISLIAAAFFGVPLRFAFEWWTGSLILHGGPLHVTSTPTAYALGNMLFVDPRLGRSTPVLFGTTTPLVTGWTADGLTFHETGHTLNVAAFGSWFHYIGAIHENLPPPVGVGAAAYSELLPEGHLREATRPWFPLWDPPTTALTGTTSNAAPAVAGVTVDGFAPLAAPASAITPATVVPAGATLTLTGGTPADPDGYPLAVVNPGLTPAVGVLWAISARPPGSSAAIAAPNASNTTANLDLGGDYGLVHAVTDGIALDGGGILSRPPGMANFFLVSAVQAIITTPAAAAVLGTAPAPVAISATLSTAGTAGAPPGAAIVPPPPALTFAWTVAPTPGDLSSIGAAVNVAAPAAATTTFTADRAGSYDVTLTVTTAGGVSHTTTVPVVL